MLGMNKKGNNHFFSLKNFKVCSSFQSQLLKRYRSHKISIVIL